MVQKELMLSSITDNLKNISNEVEGRTQGFSTLSED